MQNKQKLPFRERTDDLWQARSPVYNIFNYVTIKNKVYLIPHRNCYKSLMKNKNNTKNTGKSAVEPSVI